MFEFELASYENFTLHESNNPRGNAGTVSPST